MCKRVANICANWSIPQNITKVLKYITKSHIGDTECRQWRILPITSVFVHVNFRKTSITHLLEPCFVKPQIVQHTYINCRNIRKHINNYRLVSLFHHGKSLYFPSAFLWKTLDCLNKMATFFLFLFIKTSFPYRHVTQVKCKLL